ncbi:sodium-independent sulfate anion transporter-like [Anopheles marshallii]|uniref:sodium-independent sulfate anion transporter-like n=1 Tax=Anopheles marshallii TaxID=1521116 RepID=UPI00237B21BE|nr:sodium-independent sulfate anion transporter-like [Anopheles marshallii]
MSKDAGNPVQAEMPRVSRLVENQNDERFINYDYRETPPREVLSWLQRRTRVLCSYLIVKKCLPVLSWLPRYQCSFATYDLIAGFTVALTAIPQSIAYGILSNLGPQYGLYSNIIGCLVYAVFGSVKDVTIAPTSLTAIMVQDVVKELEYGTALLTFLSAVVTISFGVLNLGVLVRFISIPVVMGFTSAACLTIGSAQVRSLLGIKTQGKRSDFVTSWTNVFTHLDEVRKADCILGCCSILILCSLRLTKDLGEGRWRTFFKYLGLLRNALIVVLGATLAYFLTADMDNPTFNLTGTVPAGLPDFQVPPFSYTNENGTFYSFTDMLGVMRTSIITIPLVTTLEIVSVGKAFSKGKIIDATQEMIALGVANLLVSFCSPLPVAGSFTRSALNNSSGVRTTMSCAVTAVMLTLSLALLTNAIYYIPKTTLASVVISAMLFMVDYEEIGNIWRTKKLDLIPFLATALACLFYELDYGILVGIGINCGILLYLMSTPGLSSEEIQLVGQRILLIKIDQSLAFSSAERLRDWIIKRIGQRDNIDLVVIDGHNIHFADTTVAKSFVDIEEDLRTRNIQLLLWRFQCNVALTLLRMRKELFITMLRADVQLQDAVARWKHLHPLPLASIN